MAECGTPLPARATVTLVKPLLKTLFLKLLVILFLKIMDNR